MGYQRRPVSVRHYDALTRIDWMVFERLMADYYRDQGFEVEHCGTGGGRRRYDGGIDLKLRRGNDFILVQCKHKTADQVTHNAVHELLGIMVNQGATGAIVVTSGEFTRAAKEAGGRLGRVQLIDGIELRKLLGDRLSKLEPTPEVSATPLSAGQERWSLDQVESRWAEPKSARTGKHGLSEKLLFKIMVTFAMVMLILFAVPRMFSGLVHSLFPTSPAAASDALHGPLPPNTVMPAPPSPADVAPSNSGMEVHPQPEAPSQPQYNKAEQARRDEETRRYLERVPEVTRYRNSPLDQNRDPPSGN